MSYATDRSRTALRKKTHYFKDDEIGFKRGGCIYSKHSHQMFKPSSQAVLGFDNERKNAVCSYHGHR